ncbi:GCN5-related N-acetyltransferase [Gordonia bronchialis DSM 43247]|uniref:GCN5-related N-acetyltransferase n=1 Tax=Gordonia bronchialis (strain ATCC 25592 / DSM 43247 / BCRC 13721 / JCM 3198 / KCTC 3076 / NBRC 16047 / NCTC 10667) TaxID=526226 RepID=D0L6H2_GORB4|nr:GNAT family protein [Gordonia bronchialis]ACY20729.1 GCN5-related N-acetyltransferase [Gordonia bronchialis DSM 43247]MCC3323504.1 GNAT family N-acetyltransferase [Gordonia bronchialis]QGS25519.1 GNAT family N-acetyltransferase [Gordonia bronchialis]STQ63560.1 Putative ribosomal N-acetyltransferase YdaF [Gordonia bronchialis]
MTTVSLRALAETDIPAILEVCSDWQELAQHGSPYWRPRSSAELQRKITATSGPLPATEYSFVLVDETSRLVGECSLHAIDWRNRVAQVGICIWAPADRGRGYGHRGVSEMVGWGFDHLGLHRLEAWIVDGNDPSRKLFESLGFVHEGSLRQRYFHGGSHLDVDIMALVQHGE